jgi:hypothetical protein
MNLRFVMQILAIGAAVLPLIRKLTSADGLRAKVESVISIAEAVAAKTPTPLDDEVLAFVNQYGREKAIDAIVQVLELIGLGKDPATDQKAFAAVAEPAGLPVGLLLKIAMIVKAAIELIGQFRDGGDDAGKPTPFPTPVF